MTAQAVLFEAVITPHRSLGRTGLAWIARALVGLAALEAFVVWYLGAWPVLGFCGGEIALAVWLLHRHVLGERGSEIVTLAEDGLRVVRSDGRGRRGEARMPLAWLRATLEERPGTTPALMLRAQGRVLEIATSLGEAEKRDLLDALRSALQAQHSPTFMNPQLQEE